MEVDVSKHFKVCLIVSVFVCCFILSLVSLFVSSRLFVSLILYSEVCLILFLFLFLTFLFVCQVCVWALVCVFAFCFFACLFVVWLEDFLDASSLNFVFSRRSTCTKRRRLRRNSGTSKLMKTKIRTMRVGRVSGMKRRVIDGGENVRGGYIFGEGGNVMLCIN